MQFSNRHAIATIPAADMARAKAWYEKTLGLKPVMEEEFGAMYDLADGTRFLLYPTPYAGQAPNTLMGLSTEDIEADMADLRTKGVSFEDFEIPGMKTDHGVAVMGDMKGCWFRDSEGNILSLSTEPH